MIPHTLVLKPGLVIHSIYNGYWFWGRDSWDAGDFSRFHGWNKQANKEDASIVRNK
jgi:hypothetical protein